MNETRLVVITGGAGDLAQEVARLFVDAGYEVRAPGRDELDVTDGEGVRAYFKSLPRCDVLVNNAGVLADAPIARMDEESWDNVMDVCLRGAFLCTRSVVPHMRAAGAGHIINIGSYSALSGPAGQANYAAAKAGMIGLTKSLARELGNSHIRANCVLPGFLKTKFVKNVAASAMERIKGDHVLQRFNSVTDAARFIVFLDTMSHVSGQVFQLDSRVDCR
ncbi:MAG: SDR family NAD(P)-dependent oxidoreductase [Verrucomicrobia bacterium]|nr:SDR family NAD(P)-dependent oxidoreductase [Verrucomicrobiota bacterium]